MDSSGKEWFWYSANQIGKFACALVNVRTTKEKLLSEFSGDWDAGIPTAEDVKFSQEIWRKE